MHVSPNMFVQLGELAGACGGNSAFACSKLPKASAFHSKELGVALAEPLKVLNAFLALIWKV